MEACPAGLPSAASRSAPTSVAAGHPTAPAAHSLDADEREPFVRMASELGRPRHLILLETARERVRDEDASTLNELRRALDAGELGAQGFQTALRLGGGSAADVKRIVFQ